jgi:hydrogenase maturation protease
VAALVDRLAGADDVVVVDAMRSGRRPGHVSWFDAGRAPLPAAMARSASTHGWGVAEAIELARALGTLPARLTVVGIEGQDFSAGEGLSTPVTQAVRRVVDWLVARTGSTGRERKRPTVCAAAMPPGHPGQPRSGRSMDSRGPSRRYVARYRSPR